MAATCIRSKKRGVSCPLEGFSRATAGGAVCGLAYASVPRATEKVSVEPNFFPSITPRTLNIEQGVRETGGSGLGLTISRHIVEAHGGSIHAKSTPCEGSTVTFELPLV